MSPCGVAFDTRGHIVLVQKVAVEVSRANGVTDWHRDFGGETQEIHPFNFPNGARGFIEIELGHAGACLGNDEPFV